MISAARHVERPADAPERREGDRVDSIALPEVVRHMEADDIADDQPMCMRVADLDDAVHPALHRHGSIAHEGRRDDARGRQRDVDGSRLR
jgi:hypothetical protein